MDLAEAIALIGEWSTLLGGHELVAQLLGEASNRSLKGADAVRWLEQQVKTQRGGVLPLVKPAEVKPSPTREPRNKRKAGEKGAR